VPVSLLYNASSSLSRRVAQYRSSTRAGKTIRFFKKCADDMVLAGLCTTMVFMSALYLIASERSSGASDIFINGVGYPMLITTMRMYVHKVNKRSLKEKSSDREHALEVAAIASSSIVRILSEGSPWNKETNRNRGIALCSSSPFVSQEVAFSIPAFYVFLRIQRWAIFLPTAALAFIVELAGVFLVIRGKDLVKNAAAVLRPIRITVEGDAACKNPADSIDFQTSLLTVKIAHEELCEKSCMVRCTFGLQPWE